VDPVWRSVGGGSATSEHLSLSINDDAGLDPKPGD